MNTMNSTMRPAAIVAAGAAGGLAEVLWVGLYAAATPLQGADVARAVTATVLGDGSGALAPALGLVIHFALSLALAATFALLLLPALRRLGPAAVVAGAVGTLAAIWTANFLIVLPALGSGFDTLMPLPVTLASKLLFGLALAAVLVRLPRRSMARLAAG